MKTMDESRESRRRQPGRARQRQLGRQGRREAMATLRSESSARLPDLKVPAVPGISTDRAQQVGGVLRDIWWRINQNSPLLRAGAVLLVIGLIFFAALASLAGQIGPNIWALNVPLGGLSPDDAAQRLQTSWASEIRITLYLEGESYATLSPEQLGLRLDAGAIVDEALAAGLSGFPFGISIAPVMSVDVGTAQNYLLDQVEKVYQPPFDAGYTVQNGEIVGVPGRGSREMDIPSMLDRLQQDTANIVRTRRLDMMLTSTPPTSMDPSPYLEQARLFVRNGFRITGYDPFVDEMIPWSTTPEEIVRWLVAGPNGLTLREDAFRRFVILVNEQLNSGAAPRYLDEREASRQVADAIRRNAAEANVRVRYLPTTYTIASRDTGFRIGRKTGLPFQLIDNANPGMNWNTLSVGQTISLPSRDLVLPEDVIPGKRIVVDLDRLWLVAYENGEMVFSWPISSGRNDAPTYPGIFQILSKVDVAYGSTFDLCGASGCGQWEMSYFMGIYEVAPGLTNGFHGAVLLPNGQYLAGGGVRGRTTYGCVMSENENARRLYEWSDIGTVVEILSSEFPPQSDTAREALDFIAANAY